MARVAPLINNFTAGELSPLVAARTDLDIIKQGAALIQRYIPLSQGGVTKCPGTKFVSEAKTMSQDLIRSGTASPVLVEFEFSNQQAYVLEFPSTSGIKTRFYKNRALLTSGGSAYEITYSGGNAAQANFNQSNDTLFICHTANQPRKLIRRGDTDWYFENIQNRDGPYLEPVYPTTKKPAIVLAAAIGAAQTTAVTSPFAAVSSIGTTGTTYRVTTLAAHNLINGERIAFNGVSGSAVLQDSINNTYSQPYHTVTTVSSTQFDVNGLTGTVAGTYASGGVAYWNAFGTNSAGRVLRIKSAGSPFYWYWGTLSETIIGATQTHIGRKDFVLSSDPTLTWTDINGSIVSVANTISSGTHTAFRLGAWRSGGELYNGTYFDQQSYPSCSVFHENRLVFYGGIQDPTRLDMSRSGDYENFAPSDPDTLVTDSHAISLSLASNGVQFGVWLASDERGLLAGSEGQEWVVRPANAGGALSPLNLSARPATSFGGISGVEAIKVGKSTIFIQRAGKRVMDFQYLYYVDGFKCEDLSEIAEHLTIPGIRQIALQKNPSNIVWMVLEDGQLIAMSYDKKEDAVKYGFHRHPVGGVCDPDGNPAKVVSVAVIPNPTATGDDVWICVQRYINSAYVHHIEYFTPLFDSETEMEDAFFVDCGTTYDNPITITNISSVATNAVLVTASAHGLSNGNKVLIGSVAGLTGLNGNDYLVSASSTNTIILQTTGTVNVAYGTLSNSGTSSYISGGQLRKYVSTISGIAHLNGAAVDVLADGEVVSGITVTGSAVVLSTPATKVHVGLPYVSRLKTMRIESGALNGTSLGKTQRINATTLLLENQGVGLQIGRDFDNLLDVTIEEADRPLFSGFKRDVFEGEAGRDQRICLEHSQPTPSTILAIMPEMETYDGL